MKKEFIIVPEKRNELVEFMKQNDSSKQAADTTSLKMYSMEDKILKIEFTDVLNRNESANIGFYINAELLSDNFSLISKEEAPKTVSLVVSINDMSSVGIVIPADEMKLFCETLLKKL